jgi:hypothetical protein
MSTMYEKLPRKRRSGKSGSKKSFAQKASATHPETDRRVLTAPVNQSGVTGNVIGLQFSSSGVTSATEFGSLAARYQEYRVLAMRVKWRPRFGQANESCAVVESGMPVGCTYTNTAPTTVAGILASDGFRVSNSVQKHLDMEVGWEMNPNAKLWTQSVGAAIPVLNSYGISIRHPGSCPANLNGVVAVDAYVEYDVEWRTGS